MKLNQRLFAALCTIGLGTCTQASDYRLETWAEGLDQPWSIAFLPDGSALVTELGGRLRPISAGGRVGEPIANVPAVYFAGQGGLFDVVLHPDFTDNRLVYLSYAEGSPQDNGTAIARGRLSVPASASASAPASAPASARASPLSLEDVEVKRLSTLC